MKFFIATFILIILIIYVDAKGGKSSGSSRTGQSNSGQSNKNDHSKGKNDNPSKSGAKSSSGNFDNNEKDKKKTSSSKMALGGGLLAGGMLGYAAGSRGNHRNKNSTQCNLRKLPKAANETTCCPSIPTSMKADSSCNCQEDDTSKYFSCVVECTLENEGWLNDNGTIDKEMVLKSILSKTEDANSWKSTVPFIVESCIDNGNELKFWKQSMNETEVAYSNLEIVKCVRKGLIHQCPKEDKVESKLCKRFFKFLATCAEYPFLE